MTLASAVDVFSVICASMLEEVAWFRGEEGGGDKMRGDSGKCVYPPAENAMTHIDEQNLVYKSKKTTHAYCNVNTSSSSSWCSYNT